MSRGKSLALAALLSLTSLCSAQAWVTSGDQAKLLAREPLQAFGATAKPLSVNIDVDASQRYQTMAGFGAAISDASAWLIQHKLKPAARQALLQELFGRSEGGVGFSFTRLTIGASDYSLKHYSLAPTSLDDFSINENRAELLPVVKEALAINPALTIMASPWSAPAWMKTSGSLIKGSLRPDVHAAFAAYLLRYVDAYAAEGVPIALLSVQNEPHFEPEDYPGMRMNPSQRAAFIAQTLGPRLAQRGSKPQLIEWDHNWDGADAALAVLADPQANRHVAGVGWHCYGGYVDAQSVVHAAHPDKDTWFTECSGGAWAPHWSLNLNWLARNVLIGTTRHWARGVLMWNLALDESHGPHLGGCQDCRGVVTIDSQSGAVTRNVEYYVLAHASRFVRPGARRIESTATAGLLDTVAFRNEDDGSRVLIVCNSSAKAQTFSVREQGQVLHHTAPAKSLATLVWR
ncbi:MAG TPA: glycoside hydrolase family 30 beta sandwich domain-containing protein [Burkholderiaceae bacterium]